MGYRSEVAYAIALRNREDKDALLAQLHDDVLEQIRKDGCFTEEDDRLLFHDNGVKWYSSRLLMGAAEGYPEVDAHEALIQAAKDASSEGMPMTGIFVRIGEETDDIEEDFWGDASDDGLPEWFDLIEVERRIVVNWEEV